jgi:cellulose synthase/poly-beta-1,6-N-acetylglucosamine synthase-like glycosyltransferase
MDEFVFIFCALALAYTYVGYPVLIALWSRLRPRPVRRQPWQPRVAIIVVGHNEEARIEAKIRTCLAQDYPADRLRVLIASDGSTDRTHALVEACGDARVRLLAFAQRRGKAACLNDAVAACDEEVLVFTDARQALNPEAVRCLVENLADPAVGAASGELVFVQDDMTPYGEGVDAYWRYEKFIRQREALVHSAPGVTGALYALRRSCFRPISPRTILDDVAIPMQAVRAGHRVVFDSRALAYDKPSKSAAQEKVRKVRTLAGNYQLMGMMPWVLVPGLNPIFLQFVSHKLLRLLAPFAMAALLLANLSLARGSAFYAALLVAQGLGYALALGGLLLPAVARWRLARIAAAFLSLNWYAVLGLLQFLSHREGHLWQSHAKAPDPRVNG